MKIVVVYFLMLCFPADMRLIDNQQGEDISYNVQTATQNCSIQTTDNGVRDEIATMLESGKNIIFIHLSFSSHLTTFSEKYSGNIYNPLKWVRTAGRRGRSLLYLRPQFEQLSLSTLSFETGHIHVEMSQYPDNCLNYFNATMIERKFRKLLLSDFRTGTTDGSLSDHEYICNIHIKDDNSYAVFYYQCCHKDPDGNILCQDMLYDKWINILFICMRVINIFAIMFSPYLIPTSFYRKKYGQSVYEHKLKKPFEIRIIKTILKPPSKNCNDPVVALGKLKCMPNFHKFAKDLPLNEICKLSLNKIHIAVKYRRLIAANNVPVSIMKTFYNTIIKCNIRRTQSFGRCCSGSIFGTSFFLTQRNYNVSSNKGENQTIQTHAKHPWYRYLREFMRLLMCVAVSVPWIIRTYFYYQYESYHIDERNRAASTRHLNLKFQWWNLTNVLSPIHVAFLVCYFMFCIDALVFGVASHKIKQKLQFLMRKCLRDMRDISRLKVLEWSSLVILVPCEMCGVLGVAISGLYLVCAMPVILVVLAFYCLPTINLTLRLTAHFIAYLIPNQRTVCSRKSNVRCTRFWKAVREHFHTDILSEIETLEMPERISIKNRFLQIIVLLACLLTVFSFVLLAMEILSFFMEIFIYSVIGIIMNATALLKYLSLIFMLGLYARDCFRGVSEKYLVFNKSMNRLIVDKAREKVEAIAGSDEQKNTAFQICTDSSEDIMKDTENVKMIVKDGIPKWHVRRLILFLDAQDKPYLTDKFFESTCYMNTVGVPGPLINNLVQATWRFLCICLFLMFVILIVLAFGEEYQISGTNQMLATLVGGFLPWVFRNVLFKSKDALALDTKNLSFKSNLTKHIEEYEQNWDISDIDISENNNQFGDISFHSLNRKYLSAKETENLEGDVSFHSLNRKYLPVKEKESVEEEAIPMLSASVDFRENDLDLIIYDDQVRVTNV